jgi:hypothetical protein
VASQNGGPLQSACVTAGLAKNDKVSPDGSLFRFYIENMKFQVF